MFDISSEYDFLLGAWHLAYYTPGNYPDGSLSRRMLNFKDWKKDHDQHKSDVISWVNWSTEELKNLDVRFDYIVRALGSNEVSIVKNKALDALGAWLGKQLGASYLPELLLKSKLTKPLNSISLKCDRESELKGSYQLSNIAQDIDLNGKNVLIIDDVTTSGTTLREITDQLTNKWPDVSCYSFCLGRTRRDNNANNSIDISYYFK